jgi:sugar/nucleoside kinase (ribokinase family)
MSVLVVGSIGLDTLETPFGRADEVLGGSASYFSLAASLYVPVQLVAVVGDDFPRQHVELFEAKGIDLDGLERVSGPTFRWGGKYHYDLNSRDTLFTELGVFADFHPKLPQSYRAAQHIFLANIHPTLQLEVLEQVDQPRLKALDSMNLWINTAREALTRAIGHSDVVTINDTEAREYAGTHNLFAAARQLLDLGPRAVVVKKGEHGALLIWREGIFFAPAYPLEDVVDPTGAGDAFAGGFLGYLVRQGDFSFPSIKRAMIHGSVLASFAVEEFGPARLADVTSDDILARYKTFRELTSFEPGPELTAQAGATESPLRAQYRGADTRPSGTRYRDREGSSARRGKSDQVLMRSND